MATKRPPEQKKNAYEDSDFQQILDEIEELEAEKVTIRAEAAGKCSAIAKKIENAKKTGKNLGIPTKTLSTVLKARRLERQLKDLADGVPEDEVELYLDAIGQFSWLKPEEGDEPVLSAAETAAKKRAAEVAEVTEREQAEGEAVLDELVGEAVH
jgi:uncharacterized protein (UPF0335 family)